MFSEVRQAILPIALRNLKRRGDLERAGLLVESLAKHWRDSKPFELLVVAPAVDVAALRNGLPRFPRIEVSVRAETDFFARYSPFYSLTSWYRQQLVKLEVPATLGFGGFLTLDSDVCCVGDFDSRTFVHEGRALSRWEPKRHHDWWQQAADLVGVPYDPTTHGLSVTPNILHGDLTRQTLEFFRLGFIDPKLALSFRVLRKIGVIPWTEYSLYTSVAERRGNLFDYHIHWDPCYFHDTQLFSEHSCVWAPSDFERLVKLPPGTDPRGKFIIVQSHARIPLEQVRDYCLSFAA
jgi:Family of unknown function (DUF6492)